MEMIYEVPSEIEVVVNAATKEKKKIKTHLKGTITMEPPGYVESTDLALDFSADQKSDGDERVKVKQDTVSKIMSKCEKYVKKVEVESVDGKYKFSTLNSLGVVKEGRAIINDLFESLISGFKLGND